MPLSFQSQGLIFPWLLPLSSSAIARSRASSPGSSVSQRREIPQQMQLSYSTLGVKEVLDVSLDPSLSS